MLGHHRPMRGRQALAILLAGASIVVACGRPSVVPNAHRSEAPKCPEVPRAPSIEEHRLAAQLDGGDGSSRCRTDADCTQGKNGRCIGGGHSLPTCAYDRCASDTDCGPRESCNCDANEGNACLPANCHTDEDCGGRGCSPTHGETCGNMGGAVGFYCHTAHDACVNDEDCARDAGSRGLCVYQPAAGHWACSYSMCVG